MKKLCKAMQINQQSSFQSDEGLGKEVKARIDSIYF